MANDPRVVAIMIALTAFMISVSKGGLGGMLGALAAPMLASVMPPNQVLGLLLPIMLLADVFALAFNWRKWNGRLVWLLIPGAVIGVTIGTFFVANAPVKLLRLGLAAIALSFVLFKAFEKRILGSLTYKERNWHGWIAGAAAGFASSLAHSGGPPIIIYFMLLGVAPGVFVATSVLFFAILNWIKVPYYLYIDLFDFQRLLQIAWVIPIIPLGAWLGRWMASRISRELFDAIMVVLLALTAVLLILT